MNADITNSVSLDVVRERFLQAESSLNDIADSLAATRLSSEQFNEARGDLKSAGRQIAEVAEQLSAAARELATGVAILRTGATTLEQSDPAMLRTELAQVGTAFGALDVAVRMDLNALTRALPSTILEASEQSVSTLSAQIGHIREMSGEAETRHKSRLDVFEGNFKSAMSKHASQLAQLQQDIASVSIGLAEQGKRLERLRQDGITARKLTIGAIGSFGILGMLFQYWGAAR